jgi:hypothetical protein
MERESTSQRVNESHAQHVYSGASSAVPLGACDIDDARDMPPIHISANEAQNVTPNRTEGEDRGHQTPDNTKRNGKRNDVVYKTSTSDRTAHKTSTSDSTGAHAK